MSVPRLIKIGNRLGVTLPPEQVEALGPSLGDQINGVVDRASRRVAIQRGQPSGGRPAFSGEARAFAERHREGLHALAKR